MPRPMPRPTALLLGWGNSTSRQLRPFAELWREVGCEPSVFVPSTLRSLVDPAHFQAQARALAEQPPRFVHALSDNGFLTWSLVLTELLAGSAPLPAAVVLDSCPGIARWRTRRGFAAAFGKGLTPSALRALGRPPAAEHAVLTPAIELAFRALHRLMPGAIARMTDAPEQVLGQLPPRPHLAVFGPDDAAVPEAESLAFVAALRDRGHAVETLRVVGSGHVAHLKHDRAGYREAVRRLVERTVTTPG